MPKRRVNTICQAALVAALVITPPLLAPAAASAQFGIGGQSASQQPSGLTMSPPLANITLNSGLVEAHNNITLTNHNNQPVSIKLKPVDLSSLGLAGGFGFDQAASASLSKYGLANWMTLPNGDQATIAPGATVQLPVYVENRSDLAPGGHYGAVVITNASDSQTAGKVSLSRELVSLLFVTKLGGEQYGVTLTNMKPASAGIHPSSVQLTFHGTGNVHSTPRGFVQLTDPRGKVVSKGIINTESVLLLPGATRELTVPLRRIANSSNVPGSYTLTAYYRPDGVDHFTTYSLKLRAWSWVQLAVLIIVIVALVGGGFAARHLQLRRRNSRAPRWTRRL